MRWGRQQMRVWPDVATVRVSAFEIYRDAFRETPLFFETMRAHPTVFRGRFTLQFDHFTGKSRLLDRKGTR